MSLYAGHSGTSLKVNLPKMVMKWKLRFYLLVYLMATVR